MTIHYVPVLSRFTQYFFKNRGTGPKYDRNSFNNNTYTVPNQFGTLRESGTRQIRDYPNKLFNCNIKSISETSPNKVWDAWDSGTRGTVGTSGTASWWVRL